VSTIGGYNTKTEGKRITAAWSMEKSNVNINSFFFGDGVIINSHFFDVDCAQERGDLNDEEQDSALMKIM